MFSWNPFKRGTKKQKENLSTLYENYGDDKKFQKHLLKILKQLQTVLTLWLRALSTLVNQ